MKTKMIENEIYDNGEIKVSVATYIEYIKVKIDDSTNYIDTKEFIKANINTINQFQIECDLENEICYVKYPYSKLKFNDYVYDLKIYPHTLELRKLTDDKIILGVQDTYCQYYEFDISLLKVILRKCGDRYGNSIYYKMKSEVNLEQVEKEADKLTLEYISQKNKHGSWGQGFFYDNYKEMYRYFRHKLLEDKNKLYDDTLNNIEICKQIIKRK